MGTANGKQRPKIFTNGEQRVQLNHPTHAKPIVSFAGLIAQKYQQKKELEDKEHHAKRRKNLRK